MRVYSLLEASIYDIDTIQIYRTKIETYIF